MRHALALGLLSSVATLLAGPININFETGSLTGWTSYGNVAVTGTTFGVGPIQGSYSGLVFDGQGSVPISTIEAALGLNAYGINIASATGVAVTEGSALLMTFTAQPGDTIALPFRQLTNMASSLGVHETFFMFVLGPNYPLSYGAGGTATYVAAPLSTGFAYVQQGSFGGRATTLNTAGTYTVGFIVADDGTSGVKSGLMVDGTYAAATPEPSAVWLAGGGLIVLAWTGRRRFRPLTKQG